MAHSNPEFALGLMRPEKGPVRYQLPGPASLASLRQRMLDIGDRLKREMTVSAQDAQTYQLWRKLQRQERAAAARDRILVEAVSERPHGMHGGGRADERVHEPFRRSPVNIQAGRPDKPRRGTLPR